MSQLLSIRRTALGVAFVVALALFAALVGSAPANAGATDCPTGSGLVCLYKNSSYATGGKAEYSGAVSNYSGKNFDWCYLNCDLNDATSSIRNRGNSYNTRHYTSLGYTGNWFTLLRGSQVDLYGNLHNDELSSHKWV